MSKVAVVYWSSTGNTEAMANAVVDGIKEKGGLINQYIQDLRDQKELLTKYLQSIANVIKDFLNSMQFQQLNDLFNITYSLSVLHK